ncbi:MAG: HEAT repeat domain-containing protein [Gemmataceae bacterium]
MRRGITRGHSFSLRRWLLLGALGLGAVGCANFNLWDDVTSREFKFKNLYSKPDPMTVLRDNPDGDARARAMKALKEPALHGKPQDQDDAVNYLTQAAVSDPRPLVRLAAIDALGRFQDARCAGPLVQAYQAAADKTFAPDHVNSIRCEALAALGKKKSTEATTVLLDIAGRPKPEKSTTQLTALNVSDPLNKVTQPDDDDPAQRNLRLAAVRALGEQGSQQAVPLLIPMLGDKDVALRDRAYEALQKLTGRKNLPLDAKEWQAALAAGELSAKP